MTKYILDTNILSYLWDSHSEFHEKVKEFMLSLDENDELGISVLSFYELVYGEKSLKKLELKKIFQKAIDEIKNEPNFQIFPLTYIWAETFANLKFEYKKKIWINSVSIKKNDLDFLIASLCISQNAILISNDKIFEIISELDNKFKYKNLTL